MPTEIIFESGAIDKLAEFLAPIGERPLLVTGRHSARKTGMLDKVLGMLPDVVVFDQVEENPTTSTCESGAKTCRDHQCDCVIALGGGSPIDAAKAIAFLATNTGRCTDYLGNAKPRNSALPILAIPTTAGTGSEVTPYAVLVDIEKNTKRTLTGRDLFPRIALLDPNLTITQPREVTLATGLDALSQGMEGFISRKATRKGDILALETCRLIKRWLPVVLREPENLMARTAMLEAAMLSGCVIAQSGTTLVHGMGYYFTLHHGIAHGIANALLLSPVFQWNAQHAPDKVALLANTLGFPVETSDPEKVEAAIREALLCLFDACEWCPKASAYGVPQDCLVDYSTDIYRDQYRFKNQIGNPGLDSVQSFYEAAWSGTSI